MEEALAPFLLNLKPKTGTSFYDDNMPRGYEADMTRPQTFCSVVGGTKCTPLFSTETVQVAVKSYW